MESRNQNLEQREEKQPYETPQLTNHGSVEQSTGVDGSVSSLTPDN